MADQADLDLYSLTDRIFRLSMGELAVQRRQVHGDFSLSLADAQRRKHEYVAEQIRIAPSHHTLTSVTADALLVRRAAAAPG